MSVDKMLRDLVRAEVQQLIVPLTSAVEQLQAQGLVVSRLAAALGQPIKRGPGRPPKSLFDVRVLGRKSTGRPAKRIRRASEGDRPCALKDCKRLARSKGFCAAHYQKYRLLSRTGRLPSSWVEYASPNSIPNVVLPRGRAGAKALHDAKKRSRS